MPPNLQDRDRTVCYALSHEMFNSINTLDFRVSKNHGLSFELLVDGKPISQIAGSSSKSIPYWLFMTGVALLPLSYLGSDSDRRVVAVCSCGEWGCGSLRCNIVKSWDGNVVFRDFTTDLSCSELAFSMMMLCFSAANYDFVVSEILHTVKAYENL